MEDDNIEHRKFWDRVEKIKTDFGIDISKSERALEVKVLEFSAILEKESRFSIDDDRFVDAYKQILRQLHKKYQEHFDIITHKQGKIEPINIQKGKFTLETLGLTQTHCRECLCHLSECKCTNKTVGVNSNIKN